MEKESRLVRLEGRRGGGGKREKEKEREEEEEEERQGCTNLSKRQRNRTNTQLARRVNGGKQVGRRRRSSEKARNW